MKEIIKQFALDYSKKSGMEYKKIIVDLLKYLRETGSRYNHITAFLLCWEMFKEIGDRFEGNGCPCRPTCEKKYCNYLRRTK